MSSSRSGISRRVSGYMHSFSRYVWTVSSSRIRFTVPPLVLVALAPASRNCLKRPRIAWWSFLSNVMASVDMLLLLRLMRSQRPTVGWEIGATIIAASRLARVHEVRRHTKEVAYLMDKVPRRGRGGSARHRAPLATGERVQARRRVPQCSGNPGRTRTALHPPTDLAKSGRRQGNSDRYEYPTSTCLPEHDRLIHVFGTGRVPIGAVSTRNPSSES